MGDIPTHNFRNYHQPPIEEADYTAGPRVWLDNRHKLVLTGPKPNCTTCDRSQRRQTLRNSILKSPTGSPANPHLATSVLNSLREKDYPKK